MNEMWRVRQKELELNEKLKRRSKDQSSCSSHADIDNSSRSLTNKHVVDDKGATASSSKRECESNHSSENEGLRDEEVEVFLHSR